MDESTHKGEMRIERGVGVSTVNKDEIDMTRQSGV